jgi:hypothetical protein
MVTKSTGRPRGRPRKSVASPAVRPAHSPSMPLANDPDRWALAFVERGIRAGTAQGISELRIIDTFVSLKRGGLLRTPDNLERFRSGRPFRVWTPPLRLPPWRVKQGLSDRCESWRYKNAFRPYVDDFRSKLRRYRKRDDDARRLRTMADIWEICLRGNRVDKARRLAASIGETKHLEEILRPSFFTYAARPVGRPLFP